MLETTAHLMVPAFDEAGAVGDSATESNFSPLSEDEIKSAQSCAASQILRDHIPHLDASEELRRQKAAASIALIASSHKDGCQAILHSHCVKQLIAATVRQDQDALVAHHCLQTLHHMCAKAGALNELADAEIAPDLLRLLSGRNNQLRSDAMLLIAEMWAPDRAPVK